MRRLNYPYSILRFAPSMRCNFTCSYCTHFEYQLNIKEKGQPTRIPWKEQPPEVWIKHLERLRPLRNLRIIIGVGEPTIYSGIEEVVNSLTYPTSLYTNASNLAIKKIRRFVPRRDLSLYVSFHPTGMSIENFIENAKYLQKTFNIIDFHSVPHPGSEEVLAESQIKAAEQGVILRVDHPFTAWNDERLYFYDDHGGDQARFRDRFAGRLNGETKDVMCKVSTNHFENNMSMVYPIAPNGDVYVCWRYFLAGSTEGILGNFFDEDFKYTDEYFACSKYGDCNICSWDNNIIDKATGRQLDNDTVERVYV